MANTGDTVFLKIHFHLGYLVKSCVVIALEGRGYAF